ncbi:hypothetical protein O181_036473 [Austropuccinia psidii MF-1]|uniref:Uncharacterized protein n=1 Tax=Austropuccinia psidii MF-1 TaxID=1389203 RepID=A0A9Q3D7H9_9BASI|nr:hypothetical protein [Austropuccinia psidii MF-1]
MRVARFLRQTAKEAQGSTPRQRPTDPDPFKYHTTPPSEFWDKFRKMLVVNPESSSGAPLAIACRSPPPASITTVQVTPASKASDPAQNPYYERDFRRMYPRLEMITQTDLCKLLIRAPEQMKLPAPASKPSLSAVTITSGNESTPSLASLYLSPTASSSSSSINFKPPSPPGKPYRYKLSEQPPQQENSYFPMQNFC